MASFLLFDTWASMHRINLIEHFEKILLRRGKKIKPVISLMLLQPVIQGVPQKNCKLWIVL